MSQKIESRRKKALENLRERLKGYESKLLKLKNSVPSKPTAEKDIKFYEYKLDLTKKEIENLQKKLGGTV